MKPCYCGLLAACVHIHWPLKFLTSSYTDVVSSFDHLLVFPEGKTPVLTSLFNAIATQTQTLNLLHLVLRESSSLRLAYHFYS